MRWRRAWTHEPSVEWTSWAMLWAASQSPFLASQRALARGWRVGGGALSDETLARRSAAVMGWGGGWGHQRFGGGGTGGWGAGGPVAAAGGLFPLFFRAAFGVAEDIGDRADGGADEGGGGAEPVGGGAAGGEAEGEGEGEEAHLGSEK